jgi:predicted HNH restriction endonuclease
VAFLKRDGNPYVEAHHVVPVSEQQVGSLSASNVITVCPNHHRQLHYGDVQIEVTDTTFEIRLDGETVSVERFSASR